MKKVTRQSISFRYLMMEKLTDRVCSGTATSTSSLSL